MIRVLVTGGSGFVGCAVARELNSQEHFIVRTTVRDSTRIKKQCGAEFFIGELSSKTDWSDALDGVDVVVHTAARVHMMNDKSANPLAKFRLVNVEATANLARQAANAGVRRFIYLSSVKVNGDSTTEGQPFVANSLAQPLGPYAVSKLEAEQLLRHIASQTGIEVVIIRPPLIYGPGVKANFESMMRCLALGVPLPLAAVSQNKRSFVALDNLVDLIKTCINHPAAANQTFLISDGEDLSTVELIKRTATAMGRPAKLFNIPLVLLRLGSKIMNRQDIYLRLCSSLQLNIAKTHELLGWSPIISVDEGLRRAAEGFKK